MILDDLRGKLPKTSKLTYAEADYIRAAHAAGCKTGSLMRIWSLSKGGINAIVAKRSYVEWIWGER